MRILYAHELPSLRRGIRPHANRPRCTAHTSATVPPPPRRPAEQPGCSFEEQYATLKQHFEHTATSKTRCLMLTAYAKLSNLHPPLRPQVRGAARAASATAAAARAEEERTRRARVRTTAHAHDDDDETTRSPLGTRFVCLFRDAAAATT